MKFNVRDRAQSLFTFHPETATHFVNKHFWGFLHFYTFTPIYARFPFI